jgi:hypothetical protein
LHATNGDNGNNNNDDNNNHDDNGVAATCRWPRRTGAGKTPTR